jgi:hypothetical protein
MSSKSISSNAKRKLTSNKQGLRNNINGSDYEKSKSSDVQL